MSADQRNRYLNRNITAAQYRALQELIDQRL